MRSKYILMVVSVLLAIVAVAMAVSAGDPVNPPGAPGATNSYTLEDIYNRLDTGTAGTQSTFTEPSEGPPTGTMYTLNDVMSVAPAVDDTNGATKTHLLAGMTAWGLNSGEWGPITGIRPYAPVPKTGQTIPDTTGDDGQLQMGVVWPAPRFITGTTGVVTDTLTGLIWLENAHCAKTTRDWSTALLGDITNLNAFGTMNGYDCGDTSNGGSHQTDWRLPNVREMQSLVHYGFYNLALPNTVGTGQYSQGDPFIGVQPYYYWTSTTRASNTSWAWSVDMVSGEVNTNLKTNIYDVWPVRGGQ